MIKIYDNFISKEDHKKIHDLMHETNFFTWSSNKVYEENFDKSLQNGQFGHLFYKFNEGEITISDYFDHLKPFFTKVKPIALNRIKANFVTYSGEKSKASTWHVDLPRDARDAMYPVKNMTTGIYYINTNNGYTEFMNGDKCESVSNRMVMFPSNFVHRAVNSTDSQYRFLINFNWVLPVLDTKVKM
tara:strand:- start:219 stop:779 length:561 start_codon:yes stop_codon:yes gene_type:complete